MPVNAALVTKVATYGASVPDHAIADELNAPSPTGAYGTAFKLIPAETMRGVLLLNDDWANITIISQTVGNAQRVNALSFREWLTTASTIDMSITEVLNRINLLSNALIAAGVMTQASKDLIVTLSTRNKSWIEVNSTGALTPAMVRQARNGVLG